MSGHTLSIDVTRAILEARYEDCRLICPHCRAGLPHHTNAVDSIGGPNGRHTIWELHVGTGGGLVECWAAPIWEALANA
jgi:hypothetical protein